MQKIISFIKTETTETSKQCSKILKIYFKSFKLSQKLKFSQITFLKKQLKLIKKQKIPNQNKSKTAQVSPPRVSYRERIAAAVPFNYQFKKQTGGRGLYAKIIGRIEPVPLDHADFPAAFVSLIKGLVIPPEFVASVEKGFRASLLRGPLTGSPVQGVRFVLEDGVTHEVDSCDLAFFQAAQGALREAFAEAGMALYEPSMLLEVSFPAQFQSAVVAGLSRLSAQVKDMDRQDETCVVKAEAPLEQMFGYAAQLRGSTEGKGEFAMEYRDHVPMVPFKQRQVVARYSESRARK